MEEGPKNEFKKKEKSKRMYVDFRSPTKGTERNAEPRKGKRSLLAG